MRTSKSGSHTKALTRSDHDIRPAFARRLEKRESEQIGRYNRQCARCVGAGCEFFQITDRTVGGGVLEEGSKNRLLRALLRGTSQNPDAKWLGTGLQNGESLRMDMVRHEDRVTAFDVLAKGHGLCGGSGFVEQGGVGNLHPGQVANHRLEIQERLEATLGDLRLIRRVGGIPTGIFENVSANDRRRVCAVNAHAKVVRGDLIFRHDRLQFSQSLLLRAGGGEIQITLQADRKRHSLVDQRIQRRGADRSAHGFNFSG